MEILRCPACGWPTPKGRPCPRGCSATAAIQPAGRIRPPIHVAELPAQPVIYRVTLETASRDAQPAADLHPESRTARRVAARRRTAGRGRAVVALAVAIVILLAGGTAFAINTFEGSTAESTGQTVIEAGRGDQAAQLVQKAASAFGSGNLDQALTYYEQALQADPGCGVAYHGKWHALMNKGSYGLAEDVAAQATSRFPTSRAAWYDLGFAQEAQYETPAAAASYTKSLQFPADAGALGVTIADTDVHKRLDLVSYMGAITAPREAIATAVGRLQTALKSPGPDMSAVSAATTQAAAALDDNIAALESVRAPADLADFNTTMLSAYRDIETACDSLASAAAVTDTTALATARTGLDDAVDRFNENDKQGSALVQSYYQS